MPAAGHAATGTISYNGVEFDKAARVTVESEAIRDEADRTTVCREYRFTIHTVMQSATGTNNDLYLLRTLLSEDGKVFIFTGRGFGNDLIINTGRIKDVAFGPKPRILAWNPIGQHNACEVVWTMTTRIPECESPGATRYGGIMAFNWEVGFAIDEHGDTTRTISGYAEIALTRAAFGRQLTDIADAYRRVISPVPPDGFRRSQNWQVSKDKRRLDFTITDTQIASDNAYPPDLTQVNAVHSMRWSRIGGIKTYRNVIEFDFTVRRGVDRSTAFNMFLQIVFQRTGAALNRGHQVLVDEIQVTEDIFSRSGRFLVAYRELDSLNRLLDAQGQFTPTLTTWGLWKTSMGINVFNHRGNANLAVLPAADTIVDLCAGEPFLDLAAPQPTYNPNPYRPVLTNRTPKREQSYIHYEPTIHINKYQPTMRHSYLQDGEPADSGSADSANLGPNHTIPTQFPPPGGPETNDPIIKRGRPVYTASFSGSAIRAGYEIPRPALVQCGGQIAVEKSGQFVVTTVGDFLGVPVYAAAWNIEYYLQNSPGQTNAPFQLPTV